MGSRHGPVERARDRSGSLLHAVGRDLREARVQHGLSLADVGLPADLSPAQLSRIERGLVRSLNVETVAILCATVGLDLAVRTYPAGEPLRDVAHLALLERLRGRLHPRVRWRPEVPLPLAGDMRAWDAVATIEGRAIGVEAETRPRDLQALLRRLALKRRDGRIDTLILLLSDTRANRRLLRANGPALTADFPLPGRRALELLVAGVHPDASAVVLL